MIVGFQGDWLGEEQIAGSPWTEAPRETWDRWHAAGADEVGGDELAAKITELIGGRRSMRA